MKARIAIVGAVLFAALIALWWWRHDSASTAAPSATAHGSAHGSGEVVTVQQQAFPSDRPLPRWFVRTNAKTRHIAGRVTLDGKPAGGAMVTLISMLTQAGYGKAIEVRAGSDGAFDLGDWPGGRYSIAASAPDTQMVTKQLDLADPGLVTEAIELRLRACQSRISGTISDASGAPIVEAQVRREGFVVAKTDARGAYASCVAYGDIELDYSADGYGAVTIGLTILGSVRQDVVLVPAASIAGHVVRADTGAPVADAFVSVSPADWGRDRPSSRAAIADGSGAFRIDGLTPGRYRAWAFALGMATEETVEVRAQVGVVNEVTVRLHDHASISGVVTRNDKALGGVMVTPVRKSPAGRGAPTWTLPDGTFVLDEVPVGEIVFAIDGYEVTAPTTFRVEAARRYDGLQIQVAQLARIHGTVTRQGVPVEGAQIFGANTATTDASGHYEIKGLPPGTYPLGAGSDEVGAFTLPRKVTVAAGEDVRADFELELAGEISGTVVDANGQPVPDVFVLWLHEATQDAGRGSTDAQGHYRCRAMSGGGVYAAKVYARPGASKPFPPAPGTTYPTREVKDGATKITDVTIAIDIKQAEIRGRVIDSTGAPVVDAMVRALAFDGTGEPTFNTWQKLPTTATDPDGAFTLTGLIPGSYALQARATDGSEQVVPGIAAGATGVTIKLMRAGSIEGTLAGFTHPPVVYASPTGNLPSQMLAGTVTGNAFTITGVRPGRYLINAQNMDEGDAKVVDVRTGEPAKVALAAKGRGVIAGTVRDFKTKKPIAGAICHAVMSIDGLAGLTNWDETTAPKSDEAGHVLMDPVPAGTVTVQCGSEQNARLSPPSADVAVAPGGRAEVTLYSVELTVENPAPSGAVFNWNVTPPRIASIISPSGAAKAGLQAGDLILAVDGQPVDGLNGQGVGFLLDDHTVGSTVSVTYQRGAARKTVTLTVTMIQD